MLVRDDGSIAGTIGGGAVEGQARKTAAEVIADGRPRTLSFDLNDQPGSDAGLICGGSLEIFIEPILPASELLIFGAGHVALSVYQVARIAGFDVTVIDDRPEYANAERYPDAKAIIAGDYEKVCAELVLPQSASILIVTRGHHDDTRVLRWAVGTKAPYIGLIGSKRKVVSVFKELEKQGVPSSSFDERVHAPVGLEIGAITPEEIAVSIVAELIAVKHGVPLETRSKRLVYEPQSEETGSVTPETTRQP
jgi:xanthine dehydrogenase accessory factor